jgi:hypothetical protein
MVHILSRTAQENLIDKTELPNNCGLESIAQLALSVFNLSQAILLMQIIDDFILT